MLSQSGSGKHLAPKSAREIRASAPSLVWGEVLNLRQRPASSSIVASEIISFTLWVYLNQLFMSDGFKNMLEVSILNTRHTNKQMRLCFPLCGPTPPSFLPSPLLPPPKAVLIHAAHLPSSPYSSPSLSEGESTASTVAGGPLRSGFPPQLFWKTSKTTSLNAGCPGVVSLPAQPMGLH